MSGKGIFPHRTPNPFYQSVNDAPADAIPTSPGLTITLPEIKGGRAPKKITATLGISLNASAETVTISCERDGTPIGQSFIYGDTVVGGVRADIVTPHWVDDEPGESPEYTVVMVAGIGGVATLTRYTLTVENL